MDNKSDAMKARHARVAVVLVSLACAMLGLAYASVPLYRIFCQVTGYGGTTQEAAAAPGAVAGRMITIRFDSNIDPNLSWHFAPLERTMRIAIGENALAFFEARNDLLETVTGTASFNVTPEIAGQYFNKIECFCFTEQTLRAGERVEMPVSFFVDPAILADPETQAIGEITLSYTFHRSATSVGAAPPAASTAAGG